MTRCWHSSGHACIDGTGGPAREGMTVTIENGRIAQVREGPAPDGARVVDLGGKTLLPGLVEAHVHMSSLSLPPELRPYGVVKAACDFLAGGITTIRDVGAYGRTLFDLRAAIAQGLCDGPRLVLCGQIVAATSGAARTCGLQDELGTIAPGLAADLLVLDGDPLADVPLFTRPERRWLVLKDGRPVAGSPIPVGEARRL